MLRYLFVLGLVLVMGSHALAQEVRSLQESRLMMKMDEGVEYMNNGQFALANDLFKDVLRNVEVVPADLCFYFGKNSYHLDRFSQGIDWLNKYIELKGTSGRFFDQAVEYIRLAEADLQAKRGKDADQPITDSRPARKSNTPDCEKIPFVVCPVCQGEGIIIERGVLGASVYRPCTHCDESGKMKCEDYKFYLRGKRNPEGK